MSAAEDPTGERYDRAARQWLRALEINPQFSEALYNLGTLLYRAGYRTMASLMWSQTVELSPDFSIAWYNLGALAHCTGRFEEAARCWARCPKHDEAWPLPYELFHVIIDFARDSKSLGPSDQPGYPVVVPCLSPERVLSGMVRAMQSKVATVGSHWVSLLPDRLRREIEAALPDAVSSGPTDLGEVLKVLRLATLSEPLEDPGAELVRVLRILHPLHCDVRPCPAPARGLEVRGMLRLLDGFVYHGSRLTGTVAGVESEPVHASAEFSLQRGAMSFTLQVGSARWHGTLVRPEPLGMASTYERPRTLWSTWPGADLWLLDVHLGRMLRHDVSNVDGRVVFDAASDGFRQQMAWQVERHTLIWSLSSTTPDGVMVPRWTIPMQSHQAVVSLMQVDLLSIEVSKSLLDLVDPSCGARLLEQVTAIRRHIALELGVVVPGVRFRDNVQLAENAYTIKIRDVEVAQGVVYTGRFLAIAPEEKLRHLDGLKTVDPTYGMPSVWIEAPEKPKARRLGCMVFDAVSVIATQLTEVVRTNASDLLGLQELQTMLDTVSKTHPVVVAELVPTHLSLPEVRAVLHGLLNERVSIRDLVLILETLIDYVATTRDTEILTERVRMKLCRVICKEYTNQEGVINVITLDPIIDSMVDSCIQRGDSGSYLAIDPNVGQVILQSIGNEVQKLQERGLQPILLTAPATRLAFRKLTARSFPNLVVLSWNEIAPRVNVNPVGMISA